MSAHASVLAPERLTKQPGESRVYGMDFSKYPEIAVAAETLSSGTASVTVDPSGLTVAAPTLSGSIVKFRVSGGTLDAGQMKTYRFEVKVDTSGGNTIEGDGILYLVD